MPYLEDPIYLQKYSKLAFLDVAFKNMFVHAMQEDNAQQMMTLYAALVDYVLLQMGGFHSDGWHIESPIDSVS